MSFDNIIQALDGAKERGGKYAAKCPAHDDKSPSLMISERDDGSTRVYCFAGCNPADILAALGLSEKEAWKPLVRRTNEQCQIHDKHVRRINESIKGNSHQIKMLSAEFEAKKIGAQVVVKKMSIIAPSIFSQFLRVDRETKTSQEKVQREWIALAICVSPSTETLTELFDLMIKFGRKEGRRPIIKWEDQDYAKDFIDSIKN